MPPHQQRVIDEKEALDEKMYKLRLFFDSAMFAGLDRAEQVRLKLQANYMWLYSGILAERIAAFLPR